MLDWQVKRQVWKICYLKLFKIKMQILKFKTVKMNISSQFDSSLFLQKIKNNITVVLTNEQIIALIYYIDDRYRLSFSIKFKFSFEKMKNYYEQIKHKALINRDHKLQNQMDYFKQVCSKYNITAEYAKKIASHNLSQIVELLNKRKVASQEILGCLIYRCSTIGKQFNIFTSINFIETLQTAKKCDQIRQQQNKNNWVPGVGVGNQDRQQCLPSLFDTFNIEGLPTTFGLISRAECIKEQSQQSQLITCLKNSGLIPFIKTNLMQLCLMIQTTNNLWGTTVNPWNKQKSPGGSSGGEGAIISSRCSFLGIGSDIGGSIRIPAEFCGVFGLKPCSKRISNQYFGYVSEYFRCLEKAIPNSIGPLARSSKDLALFMDVATTEKFYNEKYDPYTKIVPFNWEKYFQVENNIEQKKYRIGFIKSLKNFQPSVASKRAIEQTIDLLKKDGHQLFQISIPLERQIIIWYMNEFSSTKGTAHKQALKGQEHVSQYNDLFEFFQTPSQKLRQKALQNRENEPRVYEYMLKQEIINSANDYQKHAGFSSKFKKQWIKYWRQNKIDFVIGTGFGCQAFDCGMSKSLVLQCANILIWNALDVPTGSIPITVVRQDELHYESRFKDSLAGELRKIAEGSKGLPVGIQVIGFPYQQEQVLGFMSYIEKKVQFYKHHSLPDL